MCAQCCAASQDRDVQLIDVADWAAEQHEVATLLGAGLHACIQVETCHHDCLEMNHQYLFAGFTSPFVSWHAYT